jgi:3-oxoacyl-[acyl-carrier-protein] synthase-3
MESKARITALGGYVPARRLTNSDLEKMIDTTDEWIVQRTGIRERRISAQAEFASHLGANAARDLAARSGKRLDDIDMIIVTTFTTDHLTPSTAAMIHGILGLPNNVGVIDLNAACAGFIYGLFTAQAYVTVGMCKKVLVIATEVMSKITDYTDRNTCILFGDGAGAMLVERDDNNPGFLGYHYGADGSQADRLYYTNLSNSINDKVLEKQHLFWQDGRAIYNFVIRTVPHGFTALVENAGLRLSDIDWLVPHSANLRMIQSICEKLDYPMEKTLSSAEFFGNTSSATIPLALWLAQKENKLKKDDVLALYGFGGGLNYSGLVVKWF